MICDFRKHTEAGKIPTYPNTQAESLRDACEVSYIVRAKREYNIVDIGHGNLFPNGFEYYILDMPWP